MKIAYCSDLHLEFGDILLENDSYDVLLIAGDTFVAPLIYDDNNDYKIYKERFENFFKEVSKNFPMTFIIIGNHEYYRGIFHEVNDFVSEYFMKFDNIILLQDEFFRYEGVGFFGGTLWFNVNNPVHENEIENNINDYSYIRYYDRLLRVKDLRKYYNRFLNHFNMVVDDPGIDVVFTHHSPSMLSVYHNNHKGDTLNLAYCNNLDMLIFDNPRIKYWIHGHVHNNFDYKIGETSILCNPRGYDEYEEIAKNFKLKHFNI